MSASDTHTDTHGIDAMRLVAGRYRLVEQLGLGGMGVVWSARDELLARPVAVKEVRFPPTVSDAEKDALRERTMREARAAAALDHPCAVRVFDVCEDDGQPFIVMELILGRTLSDVVREDGPLSPARAAEVGLCLVDALEAAHTAGIVHRDVKPGNVLIRPDDRVTLTDFGIASTAGDPSITSTGLLLGSPAYIAPERARGDRPEPESDWWSLGATLYTAVEGRPPFDKDEPFATLTAVVTESPAEPRRAGPLSSVLERLLDKDPDARPDADELRTLLRAVAADPDAHAAAVPPPGVVEPEVGGHTVALVPAHDATTGMFTPPPSRARLAVAWAALVVVVFVLSGAVAMLVVRS
jgi:eukaryotic-like serine/threonine-protein kinase